MTKSIQRKSSASRDDIRDSRMWSKTERNLRSVHGNIRRDLQRKLSVRSARRGHSTQDGAAGLDPAPILAGCAWRSSVLEPLRSGKDCSFDSSHKVVRLPLPAFDLRCFPRVAWGLIRQLIARCSSFALTYVIHVCPAYCSIRNQQWEILNAQLVAGERIYSSAAWATISLPARRDAISSSFASRTVETRIDSNRPPANFPVTNKPVGCVPTDST